MDFRALEKSGQHKLVDRWLRIASDQMNLFDPTPYESSPDEIRQEHLRFLPRGIENYQFGPFYHGTPVANRIMETGLGTDKTPTFGGFNTPYFPNNLYFGTNPAIASEYARGKVAGMGRRDVLNAMNDYLEGTEWDRNRILNASDNDYDEFQQDLEDNMVRGWDSSDDYEFSPDQIDRIIWEGVRDTGATPGVIEFKSSLEDVRPDEDFVYQLAQKGSGAIYNNYDSALAPLQEEYVKEYKDKVVDYMVKEMVNHIQNSRFIDPEIKSQAVAALSMGNKADALDELIRLLELTFEDTDEYDLAETLGVYDQELSKDELISLVIARDFTEWFSPEVLRGLGIVSMMSVGKANVPPITKDQFDVNKVRLMGK